jgi:hypothetical protein
MKRPSVFAVVIVASTLMLIVSGLLLWNMSQGGTVLNIKTSNQYAVLTFTGKKSESVNQAFPLRLTMDTNGANVNAVGIFIRFDPDKLEVNDISTLNSFCQFYPEKKIDNRAGTISLSCGAPHPGIKGISELMELKITPLAIGTTTLRIAPDSKVLKSDGKGTNILNDYPSWEVQVGSGI